jgi:acyl carrier protein
VRQAVVVVREDAPGARRLVAYAVPAEPPPAVSELTSFLAERLPEYMVPTALVLLPELPRTAGGKLDRRALPPPEELLADEVANDFMAPRTPIEEILASICVQILGRERVSLRDSFLDLGGHSLQAIQLTARLRQTFKIELKMRNVLQAADLAALAAVIERSVASGSRVETPPLERMPRGGELPLSFSQQRLWFLHQIAPESPTFHLAMPVLLRGPLDAGALARSLTEIVRRHETLRTIFPVHEGQPMQRIQAPFTVDLPVTDFAPLPPEERERAIRERIATAAAKPFDLERGPLFRAELLRRSEQEHVGLLCMHHIISDGWSTGVLMRELSALYAAFSSGRPSPLPELPIQYADFAAWQRQWLSGELLDRQLAYWTERLQGAPPLLALPADRPRPVVKSSRGAVLARALPDDLAGRLEALAHQEGCTLFMVLLGAFDILLGQQAATEDLVVGTDAACRDRLETEGLIGFFVNQLPLRVDLSGDPAFRELLVRVREATLGGYAHQDLPFERLVQVLRPERSAAYTPLFQVKLNLQNLPTTQVELSGLTLAPVSLGRAVVELDLIVNVVRTTGGLLLSAEYSTDLFDPPRIAHLLEGFESVLAVAASQPEARLSGIAAQLGEADARFAAARAADLASARQQMFKSVRRAAQSGGGAA